MNNTTLITTTELHMSKLRRRQDSNMVKGHDDGVAIGIWNGDGNSGGGISANSQATSR